MVISVLEIKSMMIQINLKFAYEIKKFEIVKASCSMFLLPPNLCL